MTRFEAFKKTITAKDFKNILASSLYYNECAFCMNFDKLRQECREPRKKNEKASLHRQRACDVGIDQYLNEQITR